MKHQLTKDMLLGEGRDKKCYAHPESKHLCIKVLKNDQKALKRLKKEISAYSIMFKRGFNYQTVAMYLGETDTNLGTGYVYERVFDKNNNEEGIVNWGLSKEELTFKMQHFYNQFYESAIILWDLFLDNIILNESNEFQLVDGLGSSNSIKICNYSKAFTRKKINKKFRELAEILDITLIYK